MTTVTASTDLRQLVERDPEYVAMIKAIDKSRISLAFGQEDCGLLGSVSPPGSPVPS